MSTARVVVPGSIVVGGGAGVVGKVQVSIGLGVGMVSQFSHLMHRSWAEANRKFDLFYMFLIQIYEFQPT